MYEILGVVAGNLKSKNKAEPKQTMPNAHPNSPNLWLGLVLRFDVISAGVLAIRNLQA
jgi:hypothetical protein